jgi:phosphopantothenoylcysteine synthetase/decarboxylase
MNVMITIFEDNKYTDYAFEKELRLELKKIGRDIITLESNKTKERIGFKKKDMRVVNVKIDGEEIEDPDQFNDTISQAVVQATENLSLELYGLV